MFPSESLKETYQCLKNFQNRGEIFDFIIFSKKSSRLEATLINGRQYTKAPSGFKDEHVCKVRVFPTETLQFGLTFKGFPSEEAIPNLLKLALKNAFSMTIPWKKKKDTSYPSWSCDSKLSLILDSPKQGLGILYDQLLEFDALSQNIDSKRVLSRSSSISFERCLYWFIDSSLTVLSHEECFSSLAVSYVLNENEEGYKDLFWSIPTINDMTSVIKKASININNCTFQAGLSMPKKAWIVLTPFALSILVDEFLLQNLVGKKFLNGSGAYEVSHIGTCLITNMTLEDDPLEQGSPFSHPFDCEGTLSRAVKLFDKGVLKQPLFTKTQYLEFCAENVHLADHIFLTGHAIDHSEIEFSNVKMTFEENLEPNSEPHSHLNGLPKEIFSQCLLVNGFTGFTCDPLTGHFSLDSEGVQFYENGEVKAQSNLTICGNFFDCLKDSQKVLGNYQKVYNMTLPYLATQKLTAVSKEQE